MRRGKAILILSIVTLGLVGCSQGKTADVLNNAEVIKAYLGE